VGELSSPPKTPLDKPFPPGRYPLIIVGSGPGGLQLSYSLSRLGIAHAVLSADSAPGGMFRRWPVFQRMLSWTKPFTGVERSSRPYERFDWNSLLADEETHRAVMPALMDGTSYFPSRPEMQRGLETFAEQTQIRVRYDCPWDSTAVDDSSDAPSPVSGEPQSSGSRDFPRGQGRGGGLRQFVISTSDGEYRAPVVVFAVGVAEPYRPPIPGLDRVPHYGDFRPVETYKDRRVFIIGKQNSGFEIASGLLPWARQLILASPSPTKLSVNTHTLVGVRARYVQPYEDAALAGGVVILDTTIEAVEPAGSGYRVRTRNPEGWQLTVDVDEVIAATGFICPLRDLPGLGVATFGQSRLPAQTPFWESATLPGIFFAGTITQGSAGLKKHGIPSNSGAVQGHRYNARVLARHLAETRFGLRLERRGMAAEELVPYLLNELSEGPELWHQRSYLARVVGLDRSQGVTDEGICPLTHFLDAGGADALAITLESNGQGNPYPAIYVRKSGVISEHLLDPHPLLDFRGGEYPRQMQAILEPLLAAAPAPA
jgi:thioredoxin reductase